MSEYHVLPTQRLVGAIRVSHPASPKSVTLESPALDIMTDLRHSHVAVIEPYTTVEFANLHMKQRGVRSLFVLGTDQNLQGVITATDILGEKPLRFIRERNVKHQDIVVSDIMTLLNELEAITIEDVQHAKVGHVIASLCEAGRQHTLVLERDPDDNLLICGIFSLTQIEKQLGSPIAVKEIAKTFAEIEATLIAK